MSYEIVYDKINFRIDDKIVPVIQSGSSNCFEHDNRPEKTWWLFLNSNKIALTIDELIGKLNLLFPDDAEAPFKSRNTPFKNMVAFKKWVLAGVKNSTTIEEFLTLGNYVDFYVGSYVKGSYEIVFEGSIKTTEELSNAIERFDSLKEKDSKLSFRLSMRRDRRKTPKVKRRKEIVEIDSYFVIETIRGFFHSLTRYGYKYSLTSSSAKIFITEKEAKKYLKKYEGRLEGKIVHVKEKNRILI